MSYARQSLYRSTTEDVTASLPAQQRLKDKQREYTAFLAMQAQSTKMRDHFEGFNTKLDVLGDGTSAVAGVVEHWQNTFRATHLALATLEAKKIPVSADDPTLVLPEGAMPDRLVRIPTARS